MRAQLYLFPAALLVAMAALRPWRSSQAASQAAPPDSVQLRIIVGLTDAEPKTWDGAITVTGGELLSLEGFRFSGGDRAEAGGAFRFETRVASFENQLRRDQPYGQTDWNDPNIRRVVPSGLLVRVRGSGATVRFASGPGTFTFALAEVGFGKRLEVLSGNGSVEWMPNEALVSEPLLASDYPAIAVTAGTVWIAWLAYKDAADEVVVSGNGRLWRVSGRGDHHAPALAPDGKGGVHLVWARNDGGTFHLYTARFTGASWTSPQKLTAGGGSNLWPRMASDGRGRAALVWQGIRNQQSVILGRVWEGDRWSAETQLSEGAGNAWTPSAAYGGGALWVVWDSYATGAYQIYARPWNGAVVRVTQGGNFSVRPSVAVTAQGRPVVAWEESGPLWGKDFAFLTDRRGTTLYRDRRVRAAVRSGDGWAELPAVADAVPATMRRYVQQPELALDENGRLFLLFRCRTSASTSRMDNWAAGGRWETMLTSLDGNRWRDAAVMPSSVGRNSMRGALTLAGGKVYLVWPTDTRAWPGGRYGGLNIFTASLPAASEAARLQGPPLRAEAALAANPHPNENADTQRIRDYRLKVNGKTYRILRGDLHRHTELSGDGAGDGSLDDLYRYALDAAALDYAYVADHQMGSDEEYNWWLTQKSNDLYHVPGRLVVLYGYERSVWYPNGHRNVIWARRGHPVLRIDASEAKGAADSGPILYPYLRKTEGIVTSHTSATEQGTDWRDNDPALEPLVEIYQGFESSYEHEGAPRAWKPGLKPVHQGLRPLGYVWAAWAKGLKLGVQASSDHVSTHTSYACLLAEDNTREALLDAMRRRHAYAATDSIVLDYRVTGAGGGTALMGDTMETTAPPRLQVKVLGTAPVARIDVIRNNRYIHKVEPNQRETSFEFVDGAIEAGQSYYYVRIQQTDGQLAWSSPVWVRYARD